MIRGYHTEPVCDRDLAPPSVSDEATLEVEIANLIKNTNFNFSEQPDDWAGQCAARNDARVLQRYEPDRAATLTTDAAADLNGPSHKSVGWDADITIYDPEKLADLVSPSAARLRFPLIIAGALLLASGFAWLGGWRSHHLIEAVLSSSPTPQKTVPVMQPISTLPASREAAPQQAMTGLATNGKIDGLTSKEAGGRRVSTRNAVAPLGDTRVTGVAAQNTASAAVSAPVHRRPKSLPMPFPETKPTTIDGWVVRDVANGTAVLEGPNGIRKAARGDTVPGLGTVDSIVLWGSRWIVSTSRGLITTR